MLVCRFSLTRWSVPTAFWRVLILFLRLELREALVRRLGFCIPAPESELARCRLYGGLILLPPISVRADDQLSAAGKNLFLAFLGPSTIVDICGANWRRLAARSQSIAGTNTASSCCR